MSLEHWETYYRGGALATCPTSPAGGYDQELRDIWAEFFAPLPDGARILDIATGNGAVVLIACETARRLGRQWEIHGADLARIDPVRDVADGERLFTGCAFHRGVATEKLPFEASSFDAVSGQYALEYADSEPALAQIARVLKPAGRAQFVLHHAASELVTNARASLAESEFILKRVKIYRSLRRLVTMDNKSPTRDGQATVGLRSAIRSLQQARIQARETGGGRVLEVTLDAVRHLLDGRTRMSPQTAGREVDRVESELRASVRRLQDLLARACDNAAMARIEGLAEASGLECLEREPQYHAGDHLVGWRLLLQKN